MIPLSSLVFAACLFWVAFPSAWVPPFAWVITEKAGNASLLGRTWGGCLCLDFPCPWKLQLFFFSFKLKKCCFRSTDSLTAFPWLEREVVTCPYPKKGQQGYRCIDSSISGCAGAGGCCSFLDLTKRKVFLQLRPQQGDKTQCQGKQDPTSLLSASLCEVGHWAKLIPSLNHGLMGLRSPLLVQGHQNISFLRGGQTFSKENIF